MGGMKISELDFVRLLPAFMRDDEAVIALSKAVDKLIGDPCKRLSTIRTWDKFDELTEAECDELAWELDIDWYDSTGMGLEEKRETIKLAQQIKRKRGTKWAVERLVTAYFAEGNVEEWYETGGDPYTFIATPPNTNITEETIGKFMEAVNAAKNARSHLAGVLYYWKQGPTPGIEYVFGNSRHLYDLPKCGTRDRPAVLGFVLKFGAETEPEETHHLYSFTKAGENPCGTGQKIVTTGASVKAEAVTEPTTAHAVYSFKKCGEDCYKATHGAAIVGTAKVGTAVITS